MAERIAFKSLHPNEGELFFLFNRSNGDLVNLFTKNNTGGPSIIFDRYQEASKFNYINFYFFLVYFGVNNNNNISQALLRLDMYKAVNYVRNS